MENIPGAIGAIEKCGVIPVVGIDSLELAVPLADALIEGGLPVAEITFQTRAAAEAMTRLKKERPKLLFGAGTILSVQHLLTAKECGAEFGVSPGLNPEVVKKAQEMEFPFFPGVLTPTEIEQGLSFGINQFKFFPSEASGGASKLEVISAPYAHLGVKFIPSGGININNLEEYLVLNQVLAVGGTWIAKKEIISAQKWDRITKNAAAAAVAVTRIRDKYFFLHLYVSGVVQDVGFRTFIINRTRSYGVTGWVKNLNDGRVEIEAEGKKENLIHFLQDIKTGSHSANIAGIIEEWYEIAFNRYNSFTVGH